jgi:hypothetical protein
MEQLRRSGPTFPGASPSWRSSLHLASKTDALLVVNHAAQDSRLPRKGALHRVWTFLLSSVVMFSPEASIISQRSSLRTTSKRRQRTSEGLHQQPRRKRSKLSEETFVAKDDAHVNGNGSVLINGHAGRDSPENSLVLVDMPVREKKAPPKRAVKEDNALYLVGLCHIQAIDLC